MNIKVKKWWWGQSHNCNNCCGGLVVCVFNLSGTTWDLTFEFPNVMIRRILKLEGSTCSNGSYSRRELRIWVEGSPESSWKEPKVKGILEASRMEPGVKGSSDSKALQSRRPFRREGCKMGRGAKSRVIINMWLGSKQRQNCLQKYTRNIFTNLGLQRLEIN